MTEKNWKQVREQALEQDVDAIEEGDSENMNEEVPVTPKKDSLEHPSYQALEEKLTAAEKQAHENWEKSMRAMAELDNVRRRAERDVSNAHRYALEKFVESLLPVLDSIEQAIQLAEKLGDASMREGLDLTMKQFADVLSKFNVVEMNPIEEPFNPQEHEAMSMQQIEGAKPSTVVAVLQKGYKLNDRVIRAARVMVAK